MRLASTLYVPGRRRPFADSNLPSTSVVAAWDACSTAVVVLIMFTTVPCRLSFATGFRLASTSWTRSEEHTSELQSRLHLVCRLLLEKKKNITNNIRPSHH